MSRLRSSKQRCSTRSLPKRLGIRRQFSRMSTQSPLDCGALGIVRPDHTMLRLYLFKKEFWRKHWKFTASSAAVVATLLSFGTNFLGVLLPTLQGWKESFGSNDETLVAIRSRLRPIVPWTQISGQQEQAVLQVRLRNYGDTPVLLTSAEIGRYRAWRSERPVRAVGRSQ